MELLLWIVIIFIGCCVITIFANQKEKKWIEQDNQSLKNNLLSKQEEKTMNIEEKIEDLKNKIKLVSVTMDELGSVAEYEYRQHKATKLGRRCSFVRVKSSGLLKGEIVEPLSELKPLSRAAQHYETLINLTEKMEQALTDMKMVKLSQQLKEGVQFDFGINKALEDIDLMINNLTAYDAVKEL
jgi:hypothetical protein